MTNKQIQAARQALADKGYSCINFSIKINPDELASTDVILNADCKDGKVLIRNRKITNEMIREDTELDCREMISSIMCYEYRGEKMPSNEKYLEKYIKELGILSVRKLWHEMWTDFQKATVSYAGTDCDGIAYNHITWADD